MSMRRTGRGHAPLREALRQYNTALLEPAVEAAENPYESEEESIASQRGAQAHPRGAGQNVGDFAAALARPGAPGEGVGRCAAAMARPGLPGKNAGGAQGAQAHPGGAGKNVGEFAAALAGPGLPDKSAGRRAAAMGRPGAAGKGGGGDAAAMARSGLQEKNRDDDAAALAGPGLQAKNAGGDAAETRLRLQRGFGLRRTRSAEGRRGICQGKAAGALGFTPTWRPSIAPSCARPCPDCTPSTATADSPGGRCRRATSAALWSTSMTLRGKCMRHPAQTPSCFP